MPSFRVRFAVGAVKPGHRPDEILPAARRVVPQPVHCDDVRLDVRGRQALVSVRFTIAGSHDADEDARAWTCGRRIRDALTEFASVSEPVLLRRTGQSWTPLRPDRPETG